ncbi:MAG: ATP-binding protein, partial [Planctomycetota bacterium]
MFEKLNARTREVVVRLASGGSVSIGGKSTGPLDTDQARLLCLLAESLRELIDKTGTELAEEVASLFCKAESPEFGEPPAPKTREDAAQVAWALGALRAFSFRGLAPAGTPWSHDFDAKSHLLYGPNGCGKSSLLGAIAWCLTGRIFRDDRPPSAPVDVDVYSSGDNPQRAGTHPDALTLLDAAGKTTRADTVYWVELQLRGTDKHGAAREFWIRRHSTEGLATSSDGRSWTPVGTLDDAGISELDAELHVVMPARVPHLKFGENPDLVRLFSQIVGLDDLEDVSALAGKSSQALKSRATRIENKDVEETDRQINAALDAIEDAATDEVRTL